jgi:hypothetical protein
MIPHARRARAAPGSLALPYALAYVALRRSIDNDHTTECDGAALIP